MTTTTKVACDLADVKRALDVLKEPGHVVELRALDVSEPSYRAPHTVSGYFDDFDRLAAEAVRLSPCARGVYVTLNEIEPDLLARAANRARPVGRRDPTTSDNQVTRRRWLLVDVDPVRPSGISSSEEEWGAARNAALAIQEYLSLQSWPSPVLAASGNGFHLLYRIDLPPDDGGLVQRVLSALAFRFDDDTVTVDTSVFNPARIFRLYGTVARKGDHTPDRPHRVARILDAPERLDVVSPDLLETLARTVPTPEASLRQSFGSNGGAFDLDVWMAEYFPEADGPRSWEKGRRWVFPTCPWNPDHQDRSAYVVQLPNGAVAAGCHHNGCNGKGWRDLRDIAEPGWRQRQTGDNGRSPKPQTTEPAEQVELTGLEALLFQVTEATPEERPAALMTLAEAVAHADPFTVEEYARRVKEAGLATIGTFVEAVGTVQKQAALHSGTRNAEREAREGKRPSINAGDMNLPRVTEAAWRAIGTANHPPVLFRFGGLPTRIESGDDGAPTTQPMTEARMRHFLARAATWYRVTEEGDVPALPPFHVVSDVLATPDMPLPILETIVSAPIFAPNGTLQLTPGYHPQARAYYHPEPGFVVPEVPKEPTTKDVERARRLILDDLLGDFPFVALPDDGGGRRTANAERAHAVSVLLLPFVRAMISGATPLHLIEKPSPGTGASLLVDVLLHPATGRPVTAMTEGRSEPEWRKRLTAKLLNSPQAVFIDNLRRRLDSAALAAAITASVWEDRILGQSVVARIPVRCVWVATGNNPTVSDEIARRSVRIRIDAQCDRPWLRREFRHPNLRRWVQKHRGELVWAALTLVQNWIVQGKPTGDYTLGMFQVWANTMGGILDAADIPGFLENLVDFYDQADVYGALWRAFVAAWWEKFQDQEVGVSDLFVLADRDVSLDLGNGNERSQQTRLGLLLRQRRDRRYQIEVDDQVVHLQIALAGTRQRANQWQLICQDEARERVNVGERFPRQPGELENGGNNDRS